MNERYRRNEIESERKRERRVEKAASRSEKMRANKREETAGRWGGEKEREREKAKKEKEVRRRSERKKEDGETGSSCAGSRRIVLFLFSQFAFSSL